jgi:hypothetical protein
MKRSAVTAQSSLTSYPDASKNWRRKNSVIKFVEVMWEDFLKELEAALGDAIEPGLEGRSPQETFTLLDRPVAQHRASLKP